VPPKQKLHGEEALFEKDDLILKNDQEAQQEMLKFLMSNEDLAKELEMGASGICEEDPNFHLS
jgi:hypothetical protein